MSMATSAVFGTSTITVGSMKAPSRPPPRTILPPCCTVSWICSSTVLAAFSEMRQPIWVSSSGGMPCFRVSIFSTTFFVNSSATSSCTRKRLEAQHTWPVLYRRCVNKLEPFLPRCRQARCTC